VELSPACTTPAQVDYEAIFARLLCAPFSFTFRDFATMTDRQLYDLAYHPRDDKGEIKPKHTINETSVPIDNLTPDEKFAHFFNVAKSVGTSNAKIKEAWLKRFPEDTKRFE
jgi:hypothetical protein